MSLAHRLRKIQISEQLLFHLTNRGVKQVNSRELPGPVPSNPQLTTDEAYADEKSSNFLPEAFKMGIRLTI